MVGYTLVIFYEKGNEERFKPEKFTDDWILEQYNRKYITWEFFWELQNRKILETYRFIESLPNHI